VDFFFLFIFFTDIFGYTSLFFSHVWTNPVGKVLIKKFLDFFLEDNVTLKGRGDFQVSIPSPYDNILETLMYFLPRFEEQISL